MGARSKEKSVGAGGGHFQHDLRMKMKAVTFLTIALCASMSLPGSHLPSREQVRVDGRRLLSPKHVEELERVLTELKDSDATASGWPLKTYFYESLIPFGPPRWENRLR